MTPGNWRDEVDGNVCNVKNNPSIRPSKVRAREVRDDLKDYFFEEGAIDFLCLDLCPCVRAFFENIVISIRMKMFVIVHHKRRYKENIIGLLIGPL